jgi:transcriptional regulator with XRE-family HTH domain
MPQTYTYYTATKRQVRFVSKLIREARLARDLSTVEAAQQAGVSVGTIYRWESGRISHATVKLVDWLVNDPNETHDAFYWRERALAAEAALGRVERAVREHNYDRDNGEQ